MIRIVWNLFRFLNLDKFPGFSSMAMAAFAYSVMSLPHYAVVGDHLQVRLTLKITPPALSCIVRAALSALPTETIGQCRFQAFWQNWARATRVAIPELMRFLRLADYVYMHGIQASLYCRTAVFAFGNFNHNCSGQKRYSISRSATNGNSAWS